MSVIARKKSDGLEKEFAMTASTTVTANTFGAFSSGLLIAATSSTAGLKVLILETKTSPASGTVTAKCLVLSPMVELEIDTAGNTSQALVGTKIDLTDAATANQAATTTKVLFVTGLVGAAANKKITACVVDKDA